MNLLRLALAWLAFGLLHSALASLWVKGWVARRWPGFAPYYRLAFNALSLATALPIAWTGYAMGGDWLWQWTGPWRWLSGGIALAAVAGFIVTARWYDMATFLGLRQLRERDCEPDGREEFRLSPIHRFVRHPWYFFALLLIWSGDKTAPLLVSSLALTAYLVIGSRLEEKKLVARHGKAYLDYMAKVPGLIPLPWKHL